MFLWGHAAHFVSQTVLSTTCCCGVVVRIWDGPRSNLGAEAYYIEVLRSVPQYLRENAGIMSI